MPRMFLNIVMVVALAIASALAVSSANAQSVADFYRGKTVHMIIGYGAGGGYDLYGRLAAEFLGKHIPGNPNGVAVHPDGSRVYVARLSGPDLVVVDTATNTPVKAIPLGVGVMPDYAMYVALNPSGSRAYVTQLFSDTVAVVDTIERVLSQRGVG